MRRIVYAGEALLTADAIATALVSYAVALAGRGLADAVTIPAVLHSDSDGPVMVQIVLGPASQLLAEPVEYGHPELSSPSTVAELEARAGRLVHGDLETVRQVTTAPATPQFDEAELL
jgi:hypothetical protein